MAIPNTPVSSSSPAGMGSAGKIIILPNTTRLIMASVIYYDYGITNSGNVTFTMEDSTTYQVAITDAQGILSFMDQLDKFVQSTTTILDFTKIPIVFTMTQSWNDAGATVSVTGTGFQPTVKVLVNGIYPAVTYASVTAFSFVVGVKLGPNPANITITNPGGLSWIENGVYGWA